MTDEFRDATADADSETPASSPPVSPASGWAATVERVPQPGPVPGLVYAGMGRRIVAYILDIILALIAVVGFGALIAIPLFAAGADPADPNDPTISIVYQVLAMVILALYFILAWRQRRATLGQRLLGLIVGNQDDGAKLTWRAAFIRWLALTLGPIPTILVLILPTLSGFVFLLEFAWLITLLVTTATSPTKQGIHDRWARSLVVRRA